MFNNKKRKFNIKLQNNLGASGTSNTHIKQFNVRLSRLFSCLKNWNQLAVCPVKCGKAYQI